MKWIAACAMLVAFAMESGSPARAQDAPAAEDRKGLTLTFESLAPGAKREFPDSRSTRLVALFVPEGEAPSAFTPAGPFRATFEGNLNVRLRTFVKFSAEGRGKLMFSVGGKRVLETSGNDLSKVISGEVRLGKGKNHIVAVYESPTSADANLRLLWSSKTWQPEPVPSSAFTHTVVDPSVAKSLQIREGRALFAQFRCVKCHAAPELAGRSKKDGMPELAMDAPSLADAGARFNRAWLAAWINNPHALRPNAHMPRLFQANGLDPRASDIAAYLASLGKETGATAPPANASDGGRLFANLQCIACHTPPDAKDDPARVPLAYVRAKFKPEPLRQYLLRPEVHYAWNPMPNFHLSDADAGSLAAYLLSGGKDLPGDNAGDPAKGKQLIASVGCLNCHAIGSDKSTATFPALSTLSTNHLNQGCLASDAAARANAPEFDLTDAQRASLIAFLGTDRLSLGVRAAPEFAERQIDALRCTACHARDGGESLLAQSLEAESQALHAKFPNPPASEHDLLAADQHPPMLTWAGEKLRPQWMAHFIAGQIPYQPRFYLRARMPSFPAQAELIAIGLAEEHGCAPSLSPNPKPDEKLAAIGRVLCGKVPNQGFSCVQCHAAADQTPFAAFEAPAINLQYIAPRLRHDYYTRWLRNPPRIDPTTKMPTFEDDEGKTGLPPFDHNGTKQFEAVWQYLLEADRLQPPQ
ncbi:MAG TPA: c-type cytochrome [Tepidisphaeraceae bacterium]